jgi:hypothetical protein
MTPTPEQERAREGAGYTPGPWVWTDRVLKGPAKYAGPCDMGGFIGADGKVVCWFGDDERYYPTEGEPPSAEDKALIASAPELLEALEDALEFIEGYADVVDGSYGEPSPNRAMSLVGVIQSAIRKARGEL